ncbi:MAG: hypothetical protein IKV36_04555 [Clostridia bacterium]|nr:hypothetical protein [Clostridia bacterium]
MKENLGIWQFGGFVFTSLFGTVLHFLYDWTNQSGFIAPFSAVNESTWEHMKLLYFPLLIFAIFQSFFFKEWENFLCIKLKGMLTGLIAIPTIFYTYNGVFGKSPDWINITIFFVSAALTFITETKKFNKGSKRCNKALCLGVILFIGILFILFTYLTPKIPIFADPLTAQYGIKK